MGVYGGVQMPNINEQSLDDRKERKQILNYLAMLDEKLRYMFQNIDIEDNFSEGAKKQYNEYVLNLGKLTDETTKIMSDMQGNYSAILQETDRISSRVSRLDEELGEVSSQIEQTADKIDMVVSGGGDSSSLTLTKDMIKAVTENFVICGLIDVRKTDYESVRGGYIGYASGDDGINASTAGIAMGNANNYFIATTSGVRMTADDNAVVVTSSGISSTVSITVGSDRNIKNSIDYDMEKYEEMFSELKPCGYRYNSQKDGGHHIGFIAQDVEEVAAEGFGGVAKGDHYSLDYNSFIALNTHMIQKLMARVKELESKLEALS